MSGWDNGGYRSSRPSQHVARALVGVAAVLVLLGTAGMGFLLVTSSSDSVESAAADCPAGASAELAPSAVTVRVLNSTTTAGLAGQTAEELARRGFVVDGVGNAGGAPRTVTEIWFGPPNDAAARTLAVQFGRAKLIPDPRTEGPVVLVLGTDFRRLRTADELAAASPAAVPPPTTPAATPTATPAASAAAVAATGQPTTTGGADCVESAQ